MNAPAPVHPLLDVRDLTKHFGGHRVGFSRAPTVYAVNGVSFSVQAGETFAIVGESGCGKSTLGRLLLRLLDATRGEVRYQGEDIMTLGASAMRRLRRELQIIFQDPFASLNPSMTVGGLIGEPIALHGLARGRARDERVAELLRTVGLHPDYAQRFPHEFSGGQRQRIGIARALAGEPRVIVGDEPVSALDVSVQAQVINLLERLKHDFGLTLIMVAHDLAVIRHMSDRVAVMYLGEIVELASADALFDTPLHPYTQALLQAPRAIRTCGANARRSAANCPARPRRRPGAASIRVARMRAPRAASTSRSTKCCPTVGKSPVISGAKFRTLGPVRRAPRRRAMR